MYACMHVCMCMCMRMCENNTSSLDRDFANIRWLKHMEHFVHCRAALTFRVTFASQLSELCTSTLG